MRIANTFDILGPVMVGPSSSHTAGALRIAQLAASLCGSPVARVRFTLYNSFAQTFRGHGTDRALVGGILGMHTDDPSIKSSFDVARERGISWEFAVSGDGEGLHPNTVDIDIVCADGSKTALRGESVGGGRIRVTMINGVRVDIEGRMPTLLVAHRDVPGMLAIMTRELGAAGVNIAYMSSYRTEPGKTAYAVFETDTPVRPEVVANIAASPDVFDAFDVRVPGVLTLSEDAASPNDFACGSELLALCAGADGRAARSIGQVMAAREADLRGRDEADAQMARVISVMREEVSAPIASPEPSLGGLIGGEAALVDASRSGAACICGGTLTRAVAYAMATLERSATMGVIVAAPTAGSSGVVPGCLLALAEERGMDDGALESALYAAAAVGAVIERHASVAGAEGGCQAEVGSASAMAAAALVQMLGGTPSQALDAATLAIANLLGLVCDPVRGLVEVPCQARNAIGVSNAFTSAQLSLAGVRLPVPFDEAVSAMREVGHALPASLRETALGGLAACPSAGTCGRCGA